MHFLEHVGLATAFAAVGLLVQAEDLAWKFDASARTADVVADSAAVVNSVAVSIPQRSAAEPRTVNPFDSRLEATASGIGAYSYQPGVYIIIR